LLTKAQKRANFLGQTLSKALLLSLSFVAVQNLLAHLNCQKHFWAVKNAALQVFHLVEMRASNKEID